jgi:hypothetical protein
MAATDLNRARTDPDDADVIDLISLPARPPER